jgi:hypothetical protein
MKEVCITKEVHIVTSVVACIKVFTLQIHSVCVLIM